MDLMKAGETMLRSSHSLMPFLAPTACRQPARRVAFASVHRTRFSHAPASRSFATSMRRSQDDNAASDLKQAPAEPTSATGAISRILDGALDMKKGTPTAPSARTSRFASNYAQETSSPARAELTEDKQARSSMDDLLSHMRSPRPGRTSRMDIASAINPRGARSGPPPAPQPAPMKLGPTLGRTVYVDNARGMDVARAFRSMEIQVARNQVKKDFNKQRFHERPGMKRKRLHSQRWRNRFKQGFQATVKRVLKMRKQGW